MRKEQNKEEAIEMSLKYQIGTKYTSFIGQLNILIFSHSGYEG
jgi:hypothetical protein